MSDVGLDVDADRTARSAAASASASDRSVRVWVIENLRRDFRFGTYENRIVERFDRLADLFHAPGETGQDEAFGRVSCEQIDGVNRARLAKTIHAPDSLLQPYGVPREFQVDDQAAAALKIEAFRACIGGQKHAGRTAVERIDRRTA